MGHVDLVRQGSCGGALGDLTKMVVRDTVNKVFANGATIVAIEAHMTHTRTALGYAETSALERLLIDNILLCWLRLHDAELSFNQAGRDAPSFSQRVFFERWLTLTQRRYLRAVETLARVRKLGVNVQINVARQQIVNG